MGPQAADPVHDPRDLRRPEPDVVRHRHGRRHREPLVLLADAGHRRHRRDRLGRARGDRRPLRIGLGAAADRPLRPAAPESGPGRVGGATVGEPGRSHHQALTAVARAKWAATASQPGRYPSVASTTAPNAVGLTMNPAKNPALTIPVARPTCAASTSRTAASMPTAFQAAALAPSPTAATHTDHAGPDSACHRTSVATVDASARTPST